MSATKSAPPRVGVLLVGGFLGAGKTTLLRHLVADPKTGGRLAVLVNELGALGLDGELIASAREGASLRTVQLDSGCLCCTLKGELGDALVELARPAVGPPPLQIVVELSGAALASEVHFQVSTQALDAPFYADGLVCVVDAHAAPRWAREAEALFVDQLARADLVLLSKLDRASGEERARTEALILRHAPQARVTPCTFGDVDAELLLGNLAAVAPPDRAHAHTHALASETISVPGPVSREALQTFLDSTSAALFRIKGLVDVLSDAGPVAMLVQCVGDQIELVPARPAYGDVGPRRLIFISPPQALDRAALDREVAGLVADAGSA
jgi:cobalamin biosynthesis protein CobW